MSIYELANFANVSKTTVSRVINNDSTVSAETAAKVRDAIEKLNYKIPDKKRGPKRKVFRNAATNVALIISGYSLAQVYDEGAFAVNIIRSIENELSTRKLNMTVTCIDKPNNSMKTIPPADGSIIIGKGNIPPALKEYIKTVPSVFIDTYSNTTIRGCDSINHDFSLVGQLAASYLTSLNYKNIACICPYADHKVQNVINDSFIKEASSPKINARIFELKKEDLKKRSLVENIYYLVDQMLKKAPKTEAVFISGDRHAINVYMALMNRGIKPMKDIYILTSDNTPYHMQQLHPRPPVIDFEAGLIGEKAVEQLIWRLKNKDKKSTMNITVEPGIVEPTLLRTS